GNPKMAFWKKTEPFVYIICLIIIQYVDLSEGVVEQTTSYNPRGVGFYEAYSSVSMAKFNVPDLAAVVSWRISGRKNFKECETKSIQMVIQHGSYPVINPQNETFPDDFYLERADMQFISFPSDSLILYLVNNPLPGNWYAAVFINEKNEHITPPGLTTECAYSYQATVDVVTFEDIVVVDNGKQNSVSLINENTQQLLRIFVPWTGKSTSVTLTNCTATVNGTKFSDCPVSIAIRPKAFPNWEGIPLETISRNCSMTSDTGCVLEENNPVLDVWYYISILKTEPFNVSAAVTLSMIECSQPIGQLFDNTQLQDAKDVEVNDNATTDHPTIEEDSEIIQDTDMGSQNSNSLNESIIISKSPEAGSYFNSEGVSGRQVCERDSASKVCDLQKRCDNATMLMRETNQGGYFQSRYRLDSVYPDLLELTDSEPSILALETQESSIGGTLRIELKIEEYFANSSAENVSVKACIQKDRIPVKNGEFYCRENSGRIRINSTSGASGSLYIPYPEPGKWYIVMERSCYHGNNSDVTQPCIQNSTIVRFRVDVQVCYDNGCSKYGYCYIYRSGVFPFSSCSCSSGWRGYGCTDGKYAREPNRQLLGTLLLTLSNLFFIPAICLSVYRRFYVEAFVYMFNMFFSTFYHACDNSSYYHTFCLLKLSTLSFSDFYGSIMSFWVTLIAMTRFPHKAQHFAHIFGALGLAFGVSWVQHSIYPYLISIVLGALLVAVSWGLKMYKRKGCYPTKKKWLISVIPGLLIAGMGLIIYAFLETTSNYDYTHSAWHVCMATSICFLLPPRRSKEIEFKTMTEESEQENNITLVGTDNPNMIL
ncbi:unnamed protein product, partial [Owenia fusiformis]